MARPDLRLEGARGGHAVIVRHDDFAFALEFGEGVEVPAETLPVGEGTPAAVVGGGDAVVEDVGAFHALFAKVLHHGGRAVAVVGAEVVARHFGLPQPAFTAEARRGLVLPPERRNHETRRETRLSRNPVRRLEEFAADFRLLSLLKQGYEILVRLRVGGDFVSAVDELAHVVPREVTVVLADPVGDDAESPAPSALLKHGRRDEQVVLQRIVEGERHAKRLRGCRGSHRERCQRKT